MSDHNQNDVEKEVKNSTVQRKSCRNVASTVDLSASAPALLANQTNVLSTNFSEHFTQRPSQYLNPLENNRRASINILHDNLLRRKTLHHRVKSWIAPSDTPANAKIFGGRRAVQIEQIRSKKAGWIVHPYSSLRYDITNIKF